MSDSALDYSATGKCWGLVAAAGSGQRMDSPVPKQYLSLGNVPIIVRSINALATMPGIEGIVVGIAANDLRFDEAKADASFSELSTALFKGTFAGGATRAHTVLNGLKRLSAFAADEDWVLVHDAARPLLAQSDLQNLREALNKPGVNGAVLGWPLADSLARASEDGQVEQSVSRAGLWRTSTPQAFRLGQLRQALEQAIAGKEPITDELSAMAAAGFSPVMIKSTRQNFKITTAEDLVEGERIMAAQAASASRIGKGFDVHAFAENRPLILGGVEIAHDRGLAGHSDADVALHALCDALLGAAGLGDIGRHFPDTDSAWKGADSRDLLRSVVSKLGVNGWAVVNVDITIIAQAPKIAPHVAAMVRNISDDLSIEPDAVNVKATTTEGLGFTGRQEGIAAEAIAMIRRQTHRDNSG